MPARTLSAPSLPEAMARIRAELGPQAVVTGWRHVAGGIEMDVDVPGSGAGAAAGARPDAGPASRGPGVLPVRGPSPAVVAEKAEFEAWNAVLPARDGRPRAPRHDVFGASARPGAKPAASSASGVPKAPAARTLGTGTAGAAALARPVQPQAPAAPSARPPRRGLSPRQLELIGLGLPAPSLRDWTGPVGDGGLEAGLDDALRQLVTFGALPDGDGLPVALVGAPGSGKTVTLAKLAARMLAAGRRVAIITTDTDRTGGAQQVQGFADRLGVRCDVAGSLMLAARLARQGVDRGEAVLIDTPAACHLNAADCQLAARIAEDTGAGMLVCLPGDGRADDQAEAVAAWQALAAPAQSIGPVTGAVITRLDLTRRRLGAVDAVAKAALPLLGLGTSPYVAGGLDQAAPSRLASLICAPTGTPDAAGHARRPGRAA